MRTALTMHRRKLLAAALLGALPARAAPPPGAPLRAVGVFSLLGDTLQVAAAGELTDTRLDRTLRESLPIKDIGLDQAALRAATAALARLQPAPQVHMYRAHKPLSPAEQRALADGAARAELPAWIVSQIQAAKLSHLLLITRHRGDASFPVEEGHSIGRGSVEGVGYYIDGATELKNRSTGLSTRGFLGAYVQLRLQLMDAASGDIVASSDVRVGQIFGGRNDAEIANIWNTLDPHEKVEVLRKMVQSNVGRVLGPMLGLA